jgi:ribose transport system ATP-binding protein
MERVRLAPAGTDAASRDAAAAVTLEGLSKRFDATMALEDVSFSIAPGEVRALLGENGAGKSTLVKILSGLLKPDRGSVRVDGAPLGFGSPARAHRLGISAAFQEMTLVDCLSVVQNTLLPNEPTWLGTLVDRRRSRDLVAAQLEALDMRDVDPDALVGELDLPTRQKIEIAKAMARKPRVLLLDEATSTLPVADVDWLGRQIERFKAAGVTIVFITHRMAEVRRFCDSMTVLRNGRHVGSYKLDDVGDAEVVRLMIGRSLGAIYPPRTEPAPAAAVTPAIEVDELTVEGRLAKVSFAVRPGEVVGVAALQGMGQRELFDALYGVARAGDGALRRAGRRVALTSPAAAVAAGITLVPEDRKTEGLSLRLSGLENATLPVISRMARAGWIDRAIEHVAADQVFARLNVPPRALYQPVSTFSGGNQQKIALARSLLTEADVFLLFDPTRGVDIGTKHDIYVLVRELAAAGKAIVLYSTEVPEIVNLCDRAVVLYRGRLVDELQDERLTEENIIAAALGQRSVS